MKRICFEEACNRTAKWLEDIGIDPNRLSWQKFDEYVIDWCKANSYKIS